MRVTFVVPGYPLRPVGGMQVVYEHARGLVEAGHRVTVVHPKYRSSPLERSALRGKSRLRNAFDIRVDEPPRVWWHEVHPGIRMRYVTSLHARHVPRGDAVIATGWWTAEFVATYPRSRGVPFSLIQGYEDWAGPRDRVDATWRLPFRKIVVSSWLLRKGLELGVGERDMRLVPDGLRMEDHPLLRPIRSRPDVVSMLHDEAAWKGSEEGLRAVELARASHPDLRAVLFGVGDEPVGLPGWASYLRRPDRATLVRDVYNASAIFLCPSWSEGWGLPSAEAMACGCALVTTPLVGDFAVADDTARFAEARNPEALAGRIVELLDHPESRIRLAERGRERIAAFTWERSTTSFERALLDGVSGAWTTGGA